MSPVIFVTYVSGLHQSPNTQRNKSNSQRRTVSSQWPTASEQYRF